MIELRVNGEHKTLRESISVQQALEAWGYTGEQIAVAVNGEFVPRSQYAEQQLAANDSVEIVAPIQGG